MFIGICIGEIEKINKQRKTRKNVTVLKAPVKTLSTFALVVREWAISSFKCIFK